MTENDAKRKGILNYQQRCFRDYIREVGTELAKQPGNKAQIPNPYTYPDGNPIRPLPPLQVATGGLMIVGAYPSARFESRPSRKEPKRMRLVPVSDNLHPFAEEYYFDGMRPRELESGAGLREHLLGKIKVKAVDCWITDLVKIFLYKPEHEDSCGDACPDFTVPVLRGAFDFIGKASLRWIQEECDLCKPSVVVTLGQEVAQIVSGELNASACDLLNREVQRPSSLNGMPVVYLPHPDACRRTEKWRDCIERQSKIIAKLLPQRGLHAEVRK